ncbi:hypothetical protein OIDMADRAFT_46378 [Oidiodendron maius Zn]|uniref:Uncharacterized protein n=1 Tax=Oidiodendron maius (strain Zn) TaxID=913774 RepID=A0A0C3C2J9_OIDMZ|nr:hypothetical protein OIDMADRAFT_46378 [Oidiodendron maius Zn]
MVALLFLAYTLKGKITYSEAADQEHNVLQQLTYWQKREDFITYLLQHAGEIEDVVSCYLRLNGTETCRLSHPKDWIHGSFNICLPVNVDNWRQRPGGRVMVRFPLPFKVGDSYHPGNAEEKVRCEAATYAWIREKCPDVPIPYLWGFAFAGGIEGANGSSFVTLENAPMLVRLYEVLRRRIRSLFGRTIPCRYIPSNQPYNLKIGHLVIDYIEETDGKMLSTSWEEQRHDKCRRTNLFRGLSRIMLILGKVPLPRIGSFTMGNDGVISLTNRPLRFQLHQLENEGIPTGIDRDTTYITTESYLFDVLACHDSHLTHQLNAVNDEDDCRSQMAALATMRAVLPRFIRQDLRRGPFLFSLTDLHQSNIFVDDEWNIKYLIDLEWACSLPVEMQHPPYWLTSQTVDGLVDDHLTLFEKTYREFLDAFAHEEALLLLPGQEQQAASLLRTHTMKRGWEDGNFFYFLALDSISGLYGLFIQHIQERFDYHVKYDVFRRVVSPYWRSKSDQFIATKIQQKSEYDKRLKDMFGRQTGG